MHIQSVIVYPNSQLFEVNPITDANIIPGISVHVGKIGIKDHNAFVRHGDQT